MLKQVVVTAWLILVGFFLVVTVDRIGSDSVGSQTEVASPPPLSHLEPKILRILTMGYQGLYNDFADLWMMQLLTNPATLTSQKDTVHNSIQAITRLKPRIETFYMLSCLVYIQDLKMPEFCEEVVRTGLEIFPTSFRLPMMQGYVFTFVLEQPAKAALYYSIAAAREGAPPYVGRLVRKLENKAELNNDERRNIYDEIFLDENPDPFKDFFQKRLEPRRQNENHP